MASGSPNCSDADGLQPEWCLNVAEVKRPPCSIVERAWSARGRKPQGCPKKRRNFDRCAGTAHRISQWPTFSSRSPDTARYTPARPHPPIPARKSSGGPYPGALAALISVLSRPLRRQGVCSPKGDAQAFDLRQAAAKRPALCCPSCLPFVAVRGGGAVRTPISRNTAGEAPLRRCS